MARIPTKTGNTNIDRELSNLWAKIRQMEEAPNLKGPLNMNNERIINVGQSKNTKDAISKQEAIAEGMHKNAQGQHVANSAIVATSGVRLARRAKKAFDAVPLGQVKDLIAAGGGGSGSGDAVVTGNVDQLIAGFKVFRGLALFGAALSLFPASAVYHNWDITLDGSPFAALLGVIGPTGNFQLGGLQRSLTALGGFPGQLLILHNRTVFTMMLLHEDLNSLPANRFALANNTNTVVRKGGSMLLIYSGIDLRWVPGASF